MKLKPFKKALEECGLLKKVVNAKVSLEGEPQKDVEIFIK
jgi:hypothetical protein